MQFTKTEMRSLQKVIRHCHYAFMRLAGGEDIVGLENYLALAMWDDKLSGQAKAPEWYHEQAKGIDIEEWLAEYARR